MPAPVGRAITADDGGGAAAAARDRHRWRASLRRASSWSVAIAIVATAHFSSPSRACSSASRVDPRGALDAVATGMRDVGAAVAPDGAHGRVGTLPAPVEPAGLTLTRPRNRRSDGAPSRAFVGDG